MKRNLIITHRFVVVCGASSLLLASCAPTNIPKLDSCFYPQCAEPLIEMKKSDNDVVTKTVVSSAGGALLGGLAAALTSGKPKDIAIATAAGAVSGGVAGYTYAKVKQTSSENERFAYLRVVANHDLSRANRLQLYAYECLYCYIREFDGLQADYENGLLGKEEYIERFREIHRAMIALGEVLGQIDTDIQRTEQNFNESLGRDPSYINTEDSEDPYEFEPSPKVTKSKGKKQKHVAKTSAKSTKGHKQKQVAKKTPQRPAQRLLATLDESKEEAKQVKARNDSETAIIKRDIEGKQTLPSQNVQNIKKQYSQGYAVTHRQQNELKSVHREAMNIMDEAAQKSGIDMV